MLNATSVGRKTISRVAVSMQATRKEKNEGHETIKACKSPWTKCTGTCGTMDTAAICSSISANSILQPISSERNPWSSIPPYADRTGQQSQQARRQQAYPARKEKNEGHETIKACKSPWTKCTGTCRTMDTAAICSSISANSILQPISSERNPWSSIPPYVDRTGQQSQQARRQQAYPAAVGVNSTHCTGTPVWLWNKLWNRVQYHDPVHLKVSVERQETRASHSSHPWIWWLPSKNSRVMHSYTPHWKSDTPESSVPGHRHKTLPHPWLWNKTRDRLHTLSKDNSQQSQHNHPKHMLTWRP